MSNQSINSRLAVIAGHGKVWCLVPGCERRTMLMSGTGLSGRYCKHHIQFKARHGGVRWRSYSATDLKPYLRAATSYINPRLLTDPSIKNAVDRLAFMIEGAPYEQATRLRGLPATTRADIAFGRFRKRGVKPETLLAITLAVSALITDDPKADKTREFRHVQIAKAAHRRASGFHKVWSERSSLHVFARSTGRVLRILGKMLEERCEAAIQDHLEGILKLKVKRYGPHPHVIASDTLS
ncbi:hypothetical protein [Nitrobacter sp. JJSN]|uniref:hypothetical protein n=1 Tax=Nitrobacter sp. JJSN TaxID=3453033 RepID=UPI003F764359